MTAFKLMSLELDKGGREIGDYFNEETDKELVRVSKTEFERAWKRSAKKTFRDGGADIFDVFQTYTARPHILRKPIMEEIFKDLAGELESKLLVLMGGGFYHHMTFGLTCLASRQSDNFCYIHFDQHNDMPYGVGCEPTSDAVVHYGDFVGEILADKRTNASDIILIGSDAQGINKSLDSFGTRPSLNSDVAVDWLSSSLEYVPKDVYISMDLDVMLRHEVATDWPGGILQEKYLIKFLETIKAKKNIIGADIVGYNGGCVSKRGFFFFEDDICAKSKELYEHIVDVMGNRPKDCNL